MVSETIKVLEIKELYTVKTEMLKNSTHQSYKWVEVAMSEEESELSKWAEENLHETIETRIRKRYR